MWLLTFLKLSYINSSLYTSIVLMMYTFFLENFFLYPLFCVFITLECKIFHYFLCSKLRKFPYQIFNFFLSFLSPFFFYYFDTFKFLTFSYKYKIKYIQLFLSTYYVLIIIERKKFPLNK